MKFGRALVLVMVTASCKDEGVERHRLALEKYTACVTMGAPVTHPCFAEVLALLNSVPKGSDARARADALRDALVSAQQPRIRTPLAVKGGPNLSPEVVEQLAACQLLAQALGTATEAERPRKLLELDACRARAEKLDAEHAH